MRELLTIAELTIREARRRKLLWLALGLGTAFILLYALGFRAIYLDVSRYTDLPDVVMDTGLSMVVQAGFYVVGFLSVVLAVSMAVGVLPAEISSLTIQALAVKPIPRQTLLWGKALGLATLLLGYVTMLAGGILVATWLISGYMPERAIAGIGLIGLQGLVMLALTLLFGARLSVLPTGLLAFMAYGLAFVGGWVEQIGGFINSQASVDIGIAVSLLVPSEAMWRMASVTMQPRIFSPLNAFGPFAQSSRPSTAMLIYALVYVAVTVWLAARTLAARDL